MADYEMIRRYETWGSDALLAEVGRFVDQREIMPRSFEALLRDGRLWMEDNLDYIRNSVCPKIPKMRQVDEPIILIASIADAISASVGTPATYVVAVLVYRFGLDRLCDGQPNG